MLKPIIYIGTATALYFGARYLMRGINTQNTAEKIKLDFIDLRNISISGGKLSGSLVFRVLNPTTSSLAIQNIVLDIKVTNGPKLATVNVKEPIIISGATAKNIGIPVQTEKFVWTGIDILADMLAKLINGGNLTMPKSADITGMITANGFTTEYKKTIPIYEKTI